MKYISVTEIFPCCKFYTINKAKKKKLSSCPKPRRQGRDVREGGSEGDGGVVVDSTEIFYVLRTE